MLEKVKDGLYKLKTYWSKPPKGYDVGYKEFLNLALGFGAISFFSVLVQWTTLSTSIFMMISYFKVSTGLVFILGVVAGSILGLIRAPILCMIIDNSNSKKGKGKFKPFLIWSSIGTAVLFCVIPFIPQSLNSLELLNIHIPAIPIMGIQQASNVSISAGIVIAFVLLQLGSFFYTLLNQAMAGIEQTISTVAQERANIGAFKGLISNIPSSIVNMLLPILAGILFANTGHQLNINLYRIVFPVCAVGGIILVLFSYYGTQERVVVNKRYKAKVKFIEGAKELSKNKYFWIITIFNMACSIRFLSNITNWVAQFSFVTSTGKTLAGLYNTTLLMNVLVLGMVFAPALIKKFGKRNVLLISNIGFAVMVLFQLLVYKNPYLVMFAALLQNLFNSVYFIAGMMVSDVLDYQQYKTGKRLEGFWQNYTGFIGTIIGFFTGLLLPLFLSFGGIGFGDDTNEVLLNTVLRDNAYKYQTLLALIGSVLAMIPIFFYDLTEAKHANYVRVLKVRAAIENYKDGELEDKDVINTYTVIEYANANSDAFLLDELAKHDQLQAITADYDTVKQRADEQEKAEQHKELVRNAELEQKRIDYKVTRARGKAVRKKLEFDEDALRAGLLAKAKYVNQLTDYPQ